MDFTAPSFSLGFDSDDDGPAPPAGSGPREQPRGYAAPDVPSFSLGIDFDDDAKEEPSPPAGGRREQPRGYAAPDAPSFSLGIDFEEDPRPQAGGRREQQARGSAAPEPPSFSLGFDDDDDDGDILAGGQRYEKAQAQVAPRAPASVGAGDEDDDFVLAGIEQPPSETKRFKRLLKGTAPAHPAPTPRVRRCEAPDAPSFSLGISDDDDDFVMTGDGWPEPARREMTPLKRLRKGPALPHLAPTPPPIKVPGPSAVEVSPMMSEAVVGTGSLEDDIEYWTTDEDRPVRDVPPSVGSCGTSCNSKFSLLNCGVLMTQSATKAKTSKFAQASNSASKSLEESCTKKLLPKITISPMRKIHLLDSDTDAEDDQNQNKAKKPVSPVKKRQKAMNKYMQEKPTLQQNSKSQGTLQKSEAMMNNTWATPAFDEFCNEYLKSTKDAGSSQQKEGNGFCYTKASQPKYSIGEMEGRFQQQNTSSEAILNGQPPAMHYFFHHDPRVRDLVRSRLQHFFPMGAGSTIESGQSRGESLGYRRQLSSSTSATVPTDVGKRRVHASGTQSGPGHWFTGDNGKKVYVSKDGQELTGRKAYRQYQKESGRGFNRYRKKGSSGTKVKVETTGKQGTGRAKRKR